jgi:vacuolar protein-sorting-associated protein 4
VNIWYLLFQTKVTATKRIIFTNKDEKYGSKRHEKLSSMTNEIMDRAQYIKDHLKKQYEEIKNKNIVHKQTNKDVEDKNMMERSLEGIILKEKPNVKWSDIAGLENAKYCIKEAIVLPQRFPQLFKNVKPWQGILLYGPPGTGKSYIASAIATESKSTFFSVSSAELISKWVGSQKNSSRHCSKWLEK